MIDSKATIYRPNPGFQERFISSNVDFLVAGSGVGVGKTVAALLLAGLHSDDPNFRMVFLRRNIGDIKSGGGGVDEAQKIYSGIATLKISDSPRMTFPSGAFVDFTHMADQTEDKVLERVKGWQYSCIYVDEATGFEWSTIRLLMSRNRSQAKWTGKMRLTCNPKRNHWLRKWVDWYLDEKGYPIPERVGVVRYFFVNGKSIDDVVFGSSKEEVYRQCKTEIDEILKNQGDEYTYRDLIKSTTFYTGKLSENKALVANDSGYLGSVAAMGEKQRQANMGGCWNVDLEDDKDSLISSGIARRVATNAPQTNGIKYVVADLADVGRDNTVIFVFDGFHLIDYKIIPKSTGRKNAEWLKLMAAKHGIPNSHIIYDGTTARYMRDYIPDAMEYVSGYSPRGKYAREFVMRKDECYMRFVIALNSGRCSMPPEIAEATYIHQHLANMTILNEFVDECSVIQFTENPNGKKRLLTKKEMNRLLGKNRSMDVCDPWAMLMSAYSGYEYGMELEESREQANTNESMIRSRHFVNIYENSNWY